MKIVNCPNCNKKLGKIDEKELCFTYEIGVEPQQPHVSMGLLVAPYLCPDCGKKHVQTVVIEK